MKIIKNALEVRTMPARKAKKTVLHAVEEKPVRKLNKRTTKESKIAPSSSSSSSSSIDGTLSSDKIRLLYTKNNLEKFRPRGLETIHEESNDLDENAQRIGVRKLRRSVTFSSYRNPTKSVKRLRRNKIKKYFGVKKRQKKISMANFMERMENESTRKENDETNESNAIKENIS